MKGQIKIPGWILGLLITYGIFAFICGSFNPFAWSVFARIMSMALFFVLEIDDVKI